MSLPLSDSHITHSYTVNSYYLMKNTGNNEKEPKWIEGERERHDGELCESLFIEVMAYRYSVCFSFSFVCCGHCCCCYIIGPTAQSEFVPVRLMGASIALRRLCHNFQSYAIYISFFADFIRPFCLNVQCAYDPMNNFAGTHMRHTKSVQK